MQALLVNKDEAGYTAKLGQIEESQLPEGDVLIKVDYSTLNYKDSLAITGSSPVVRSFPILLVILNNCRLKSNAFGTISAYRYSRFI